jgi:hypothetical protein
MAKQIIDAYRSHGYINLKYDDGTSGIYEGSGTSDLLDFGPDFLLIREYYGVRVTSPSNVTMANIDISRFDDARVVGRRIVVRAGTYIYTYDSSGRQLGIDQRL